MSGFVMSHRAASSVDSVTDYNGFYCILSRCNAILASGVDRVFDVVGEEERPVCVLCLSGQHETQKITVNNSYFLYAIFQCFQLMQVFLLCRFFNK